MAAVDEGADAIGLVLWERSPRAVSIEIAAEICSRVPAFIRTVALTVDADADLVNTPLVCPNSAFDDMKAGEVARSVIVFD